MPSREWRLPVEDILEAIARIERYVEGLTFEQLAARWIRDWFRLHKEGGGRRRRTGYTVGMKTAVSIPDEVFEKVERLARRAGRSRSEVFSAALAEYVARHAPDEVTEAMDRVCADMGDQGDAFVSAAGRQVLENTEW